MIEPYCDSDEEVFFGPMTMREVKVIFNVQHTSRNKTEDGDRCKLNHIPGTVTSVCGDSRDIHSTLNGNHLQTAGECSSELVNDRIAAIGLAVRGQEVDGSGSNRSDEACSASESSSYAHSEVLNIACMSIQETTTMNALPGSPDHSSSNEMDNTLEEINKLLALEDESSHASTCHEDEVENPLKIVPVLQSSSEVYHKDVQDGIISVVEATVGYETYQHSEHVEKLCRVDVCHENEGPVCSEHDNEVDPSHSEKSDLSVDRSSGAFPLCGSDVSSVADAQKKCMAGSVCMGSVAFSEKENDGGRTPTRTQVSRSKTEGTVFAPPWKLGGSAQRAARRMQSPGAKGRCAVQSPVGVYIRSNPAPSLVQNVRPTQRRTVKDSFTPGHKKVRTEAASQASSALPVVRYASKSACMLVSQPHGTQKLPPSVQKLINTPEPIVIRHQGRFRVKNLPDVASSEAEVSILVQKTAVKACVRHE